MPHPTECTCGQEPAHPWPQAGFQIIGLACLLVAIAFRYDGWLVVAAFGVSLLNGWLDAVPRAIQAFISR